MNNALLKPEQVAAQCGLSVKAIYRAIQRGELEAFKLCGRWRIKSEALESWMAHARHEARPTKAPAMFEDTGPLAAIKAFERALG